MKRSNDRAPIRSKRSKCKWRSDKEKMKTIIFKLNRWSFACSFEIKSFKLCSRRFGLIQLLDEHSGRTSLLMNHNLAPKKEAYCKRMWRLSGYSTIFNLWGKLERIQRDRRHLFMKRLSRPKEVLSLKGFQRTMFVKRKPENQFLTSGAPLHYSWLNRVY